MIVTHKSNANMKGSSTFENLIYPFLVKAGANAVHILYTELFKDLKRLKPFSLYINVMGC